MSLITLRAATLGAATLIAAASLTACYTYVPAELSTIPQGHEVRVYLTRTAVASLPEDVAPTDLSRLYVNGRLMAEEQDSLLVGVRVGSRDPGTLVGDMRQLVKVRTAEVVDLQRRSFSTPRTALLVGGGVTVAAAVMTLIFQSENTIDFADPNDDTSRVPIFTFPMRVPLFSW